MAGPWLLHGHCSQHLTMLMSNGLSSSKTFSSAEAFSSTFSLDNVTLIVTLEKSILEDGGGPVEVRLVFYWK